MKEQVIIDAQGAVLGRLSVLAAKNALRGKDVVVVNSEKAIIIGKPKLILERYIEKRRLGHAAQKGPIPSKKPTAIVRRAVRGMIGWRKATGREAWKRVRCFEGVPERCSKQEHIKLEQKKPLNFITIERLSKLLG